MKNETIVKAMQLLYIERTKDEIERCVIDGQSRQEIAENVGLTVREINSKINSARARLKKRQLQNEQ